MPPRPLDSWRSTSSPIKSTLFGPPLFKPASFKSALCGPASFKPVSLRARLQPCHQRIFSNAALAAEGVLSSDGPSPGVGAPCLASKTWVSVRRGGR